MSSLSPDNLDPAEMYLSPVQVAEMLAQLPADHPMVAAARVGADLAEARSAAAVDNARSTAAVRDALREQGGAPAGSGRDRAAERWDATAAWQRMAENDGPGSYAARMVDALTRRSATAEPAQWEPGDPWPDEVFDRGLATCQRWHAEHQEQRETADQVRHRFADSPVDYGDDGSGGYVDDERDAAVEQPSFDDAAVEDDERWAGEIARCGDDVEALRTLWWAAPPDVRERIGERGKDLTADDPDVAYPPCDQDADDGADNDQADDLDDDYDGYGGSWWAVDEDDADDAAVA